MVSEANTSAGASVQASVQVSPLPNKSSQLASQHLVTPLAVH